MPPRPPPFPTHRMSEIPTPSVQQRRQSYSPQLWNRIEDRAQGFSNSGPWTRHIRTTHCAWGKGSLHLRRPLDARPPRLRSGELSVPQVPHQIGRLSPAEMHPCQHLDTDLAAALAREISHALSPPHKTALSRWLVSSDSTYLMVFLMQ